MRYFIAGHFWLFVAAVMFIGQTPCNWQYHSRFFGIGAMISDTLYFACIIFAAALGALHLFRAWKGDGSIELVTPNAAREHLTTLEAENAG